MKIDNFHNAFDIVVDIPVIRNIKNSENIYYFNKTVCTLINNKHNEKNLL